MTIELLQMDVNELLEDLYKNYREECYYKCRTSDGQIDEHREFFNIYDKKSCYNGLHIMMTDSLIFKGLVPAKDIYILRDKELWAVSKKKDEIKKLERDGKKIKWCDNLKEYKEYKRNDIEIDYIAYSILMK